MGIDSLTEGERRLVAAAATGAVWRPDSGGRSLRAHVIRSLALGDALPGVGSTAIHAKGIRIDSAAIDGAVDFESATVGTPLWFTDCDFSDAVILRQAKLAHLAMHGCSVPGVDGHRLELHGPCLFSRSNARPFRAEGTIRLSGAKIAGELSFLGAELGGKGPVALDANGAEVQASLFLRHAKFTGLVDLTRINVHGNLHAQGAKLEHPGNEKVVLIARGARIGGDAFVRHGFEASGLIDFTRAEFAGGLLLDGARLHAPHGTALSLNQARIGAALGLSQEGGPIPSGGALKGHLDLRGARVNELRDDGSMWPDRKTGFLKIDGFEYERFGGRATSMSGRKRVRWLKLQRPNDLGAGFKAQPWEQLIKTLRRMGHVNDANRVAIAKEGALHRSGTLTWGQWLLSWFSGLITGYGYLPMRSVMAGIVVMLIGVAVFGSAERQGIMAPADSAVLLSQAYREEGKLPAGYPAFDAWTYSIDVFLPVIEFDQESRWLPSMPASEENRAALQASAVSSWALYVRAQAMLDASINRDVAKMWLRIQIVLGWILTSLAIMGFTGLLRPARE
jgi:uncharacterized protein YjbI with pentapeptide repeats